MARRGLDDKFMRKGERHFLLRSDDDGLRSRPSEGRAKKS